MKTYREQISFQIIFENKIIIHFLICLKLVSQGQWSNSCIAYLIMKIDVEILITCSSKSLSIHSKVQWMSKHIYYHMKLYLMYRVIINYILQGYTLF